MGIQENTINNWGCGPGGPLDCTVGTTPSQHFSSKKTQMLSPLPSKTTVPTKGWNGLPEGYKFEPFIDLEHPWDRTDFENPWGPAVMIFCNHKAARQSSLRFTV
jgi:hypothetical protein